jgi:hypothetical protein
MPGPGARRIDDDFVRQAGVVHQVSEHAFGGW